MAEFADVFETDFHGEPADSEKFPVDSLLWQFQSLPAHLLRRNLNVGLKHLFRAVG